METTKNNTRLTNNWKNWAIALGTVAVIGAGYAAYDQYEENNKLEAQMEEMDTKNKEVARYFMEIEENLSSIREREGNIVNDLSSENAGAEEPQKRVMREIKAIEQLMYDNRSLINQLKINVGEKDQKLAQYTTAINNMEKRIDGYKTQTDRLEAEKAELKQNLEFTAAEGAALRDELQDKKADLQQKQKVINTQQMVLTTQNKEIMQRDYESRKAFVAVGTYKDLKEQNVIEKEGGILGIAATKTVKDDFNPDAFIRVDNKYYGRIPVFAKKAELVSHHSPDSYEYVLGSNDQIDWIEITDPEKFWESTKYLVVVTSGNEVF